MQKDFDKMPAMRTFPYNYICIDSSFIGLSTPNSAFDKSVQLLNIHTADILNICMKEFGATKILFYKMI